MSIKRLKFSVIVNSLPIYDDGDEKENRIWFKITVIGENHYIDGDLVSLKV